MSHEARGWGGVYIDMFVKLQFECCACVWGGGNPLYFPVWLISLIMAVTNVHTRFQWRVPYFYRI